MELPPVKRRSHPAARYGAFAGISLFAGLLAGVGGAFVDGIDGAVGLAATAAVLTLAMLIAGVAFVWWWRRADEAVREAHKWAWWWGGSAGMMVGGVPLLTLIVREDALATVLGEMTQADILYAGTMGVLTCQIVGYAIAWAAWWLQRR